MVGASSTSPLLRRRYVSHAARPANTANTNPSVAKVKVIPYRRTNHLLVIARPVDITYIRGLVEKLDRLLDRLAPGGLGGQLVIGLVLGAWANWRCKPVFRRAC